MRVNDSLQDNDSYFFAELKRLKRIIETLRENPNCIVLLDEILRGTNSDDKQAGTIGLIRQLIDYQAIGVVATHDLAVCQLTDEFPKILSNQCFEVDIKDNALHFDYQLRKGICQNKSAYFLMRQMEILSV
ncbi:MAG: hypothetical protein HC817_07565 [Saprospiraceae bacterium]|nr:hypothetical protein [Saprospiraceae bacterium]